MKFFSPLRVAAASCKHKHVRVFLFTSQGKTNKRRWRGYQSSSCLQRPDGRVNLQACKALDGLPASYMTQGVRKRLHYTSLLYQKTSLYEDYLPVTYGMNNRSSVA